MKETNTEEHILYDYIYSKHTKYKLSYRDKKQISACLAYNQSQKERWTAKGHREPFGDNEAVLCLNCHGCFMDTDTGTSQVALVVKNPPANAGDARDGGLIPGSGRFPWRGKWQPTPIFLPGESPWAEDPGGLQSMGLQRIGLD